MTPRTPENSWQELFRVWREAIASGDVLPQQALTMSWNAHRLLVSRTDLALWSGEPEPLYRYLLTRGFDHPYKRLDVGVIMLNPSTADEMKDDPTFTRVRSFAARLVRERHGVTTPPTLAIANLYALRSTDPKALRGHPDPVGPANLNTIRWLAQNARDLIVAWGGSLPPGSEEHVAEVRAIIGSRSSTRPVWCLGTTKAGQPRHPLYLAGDTPFVPWPAGRPHPDDWFPAGVE